MKEPVKLLGGGFLALVLFWFVFRGTDVSQLGSILGGASISGLLLAAALNTGHNVFRVLRWRALLTPVAKRLGFRSMWSAVIVGTMTTLVVPGRVGEVVRPALLSARENVPLGASLGSVLADRLMDGLTIVALLAVGVFTSPLQGEAQHYAHLIRSGALVVVAGLGMVLAVLLTLSVGRSQLLPWLHDQPRIVSWIGNTLLSMARGTEALMSPRLLVPIVAHGFLAWMTIALATWIGLRAAGAHIPPQGVLVLLPLLALGAALPTPGMAGGFHGMMKWGLMFLFDQPQEVAVAAGILMHLAVTVPIMVLGLLVLKVEGLSWHDLRCAAREIRNLGSTPASMESPGRPVDAAS